jgi:hypothetical protein
MGIEEVLPSNGHRATAIPPVPDIYVKPSLYIGF